MRKFGALVIVTMLVVVLSCFSFGTNAEASGTDLKDTWYTTHTFPINPDCKEWMEYSLEENIVVATIVCIDLDFSVYEEKYIWANITR